MIQQPVECILLLWCLWMLLYKPFWLIFERKKKGKINEDMAALVESKRFSASNRFVDILDLTRRWLFDQTIIGIKLPLDVNQKTQSHLHKIHSFWMQSQFPHQFSLSAQLNLLLQVHAAACTSAPISKQPCPPRCLPRINPLLGFTGCSCRMSCLPNLCRY